ALYDGVEDRLHVGGRAADDAEHLGGCRLMLQRLAQFCIPFLDLLEQPYILNGDDGLVGEGLQQLDLGRGEGPHFNATREQSANEFPMLTKRSGQEGARDSQRTQIWKIGLGLNVRNVEHAVLAHPTKVWCIDTDLGTEDTYGTKMSPRYHNIPLMESQYRVIYPTNPGGALNDGVEHRLHVCGRAANDPQNFG